jgi:hypothetical protein
MNTSGASALKVVLILAAVMAGIVLFVAGQLWLGLPFLAFAAMLGVAALLNRAKTPTD